MANGVPQRFIDSTTEVHEAVTNGCTTSKSTKASGSSMMELAATISKQTSILDHYLKENGILAPGFDFDSPLNFPKLPNEIKKAREEIMKATKELGDLTTGPTESLRWAVWDVSVHLDLVLRISQLADGDLSLIIPCLYKLYTNTNLVR